MVSSPLTVAHQPKRFWNSVIELKLKLALDFFFCVLLLQSSLNNLFESEIFRQGAGRERTNLPITLVPRYLNIWNALLAVVMPLQYCNTAGCFNESFNSKPTTSMKFIVFNMIQT